ncbi:MAG: glycosyltransferase family 2 protein, partial [Gammaproteobacteria bacterium]
MLSVVVNFYNNRREAMNSLFALSRAYQRNTQDIEFEVIALDHGSSAALAAADVRAFGPEFQYRYIETQAVSPAAAINAACRDARGDDLLVLIDGAHIATPGVYALAAMAFAQFPAPFIAMPPFHLGPKQQNESVLEGYSQLVEDGLLARCDWKRNGYRLYSIAGSFADGGLGWFGCAFEAGCFGVRK